MITALDLEWHTYTPGHYETPDTPPPPDYVPPGPWVTVSTTNSQPQFSTAAVVVGTNVYTLAGRTISGSATVTTVRKWDSLTDTWSVKSPMPTGTDRAGFAGAGLIDGVIYVAGGYKSLTMFSALYAYDVAADTWTLKAPMPLARSTDTALSDTVIGGKLYVAGGRQTTSINATSTLYVYDPVANTWATKAPMPGVRAQAAVVASGGKLYVMGGRTFGTESGFYNNWRYDPSTDAWTALAAIPDGGRALGAATAIGRMIYLTGGQDSTSTTRDTMLAYDTLADTWTTLAPLERTVMQHDAVRVGSRLLQLNGNGGGTTALQSNVRQWEAGSDVSAPPAPAPVPVYVPGAWAPDPTRSAALVNYTAGIGRTDPTGAAKPATCTVALATERAPAAPELGERFRLTLGAELLARLGIAAADAPRFTGEVTDTITTPAKRTHTVTGVGQWARSSRTTLDGRGWPREDDGNRVARVLAATRAAEFAGTIDAGTADLLAPTSSSATAGQLVDAATASTTGVLIEQRDGTLDWHDADHRRGAPLLITLAAAEVLNDFAWTKRVGDVLNDVTVTTPAGAVRVRDGQSVDDRGAYPATVATVLKDTSDAYSLGSLLVSRYGRPSWQLPTITVDLLRTPTSDPRRRILALLGPGDRIKLTGLPPSPDAAAVTELVCFVEGVAETVYRQPADAWRITFAVAEAARSGVSLRWSDAPAALTWDGVKPTTTWLAAGLLENPADL